MSGRVPHGGSGGRGGVVAGVLGCTSKSSPSWSLMGLCSLWCHNLWCPKGAVGYCRVGLYSLKLIGRLQVGSGHPRTTELKVSALPTAHK